MSSLFSRKKEETCSGYCNECDINAIPATSGTGIPLVLAKAGEEGIIVHISGKDEVRRHLCNLGFREGEKVCAVCLIKGDMIVEVKGSRIAIDRSLASKILFYPQG